jgi:S-formylglutathione hydrolase FrmB
MIKKITAILFLVFSVSLSSFAQQFKVTYSPASMQRSFSGKVFLYLSKNNTEPLTASIGFEPLTCFSINVKGIKPGESIVIDDKAASYPVVPSDIERGEYYIQAVWDLNLGGRSIAGSPGNIFSKPQKISINKDRSQSFTILADQVIPEQVFTESEFVKELKAPSKLLSDFHHKEFSMNAAVQLPLEYYKNPEKKFPVVFVVSGFGGDYHRMAGEAGKKHISLGSEPVIRVFLDGNCSLGHSAYANSENNGPWGDALTQELIPLLEQKYRCNGARMLMGHSSGGWTVLWLQTHYPKLFLATASSSPDYVDFRKFANVNLYKDSNLYYNTKGQVYSGGTVAGRFPFAYLKEMYQVENVISRGEQQHSFEAVFSKKGKDGLPESICDPKTGQINHLTAENWKKYDISLYLRSNWKELKNDLDGKIRVSIGDDDNFLLNYPVRLFEEEMKAVNASVAFQYYPGDHFTVNTKEYVADIFGFLEARYKQWLIKNKMDGK